MMRNRYPDLDVEAHQVEETGLSAGNLNPLATTAHIVIDDTPAEEHKPELFSDEEIRKSYMG